LTTHEGYLAVARLHTRRKSDRPAPGSQKSILDPSDGSFSLSTSYKSIGEKKEGGRKLRGVLLIRPFEADRIRRQKLWLKKSEGGGGRYDRDGIRGKAEGACFATRRNPDRVSWKDEKEDLDDNSGRTERTI